MDKTAELTVGVSLAATLPVVFGLAVTAKPSTRPGREKPRRPVALWVRSHYPAVIAGAMAYSYYVSAALIAGAAFPKFLQDHLFDGLAPAALVAILLDAYPRDDPTRAWGRIRRPITMVLFVFAIPGAATFGLIAAAAVFTSGANNYPLPVILTAILGGQIFPVAYAMLVLAPDDDTSIGATRWLRIKWWFTKRPEPATPQVIEHAGSHAASAVDQTGAK